jgi:hypothetical protein
VATNRFIAGIAIARPNNTERQKKIYRSGSTRPVSLSQVTLF